MTTTTEKTLTEKLTTLRERSWSSWDNAVSTYREEGDAEKAALCAEAMLDSADYWDRVIKHAELGEYDEALELLLRASRISGAWGSCDEELKALSVIRQLRGY